MVTSSSKLTPVEFSSAVTAITAAFGDPTRRDIFLFAHEAAAGVTAAEVAAAFSLHPNVARHHLDKLASGGYLEITTAQPNGAGRPSKRYTSGQDAIRLDVSVRHADVIIRLLGRALGELGVDRATELAEEVGHSYGLEMARSLGEGTQRSTRAALHAVAEALSAQGFAAHAQAGDDTLELVAEHCPFGDVIVENPVICAVDRGMVRGMLEALVGETAVAIRASRSSGDRHCVTAIQREDR